MPPQSRGFLLWLRRARVGRASTSSLPTHLRPFSTRQTPLQDGIKKCKHSTISSSSPSHPLPLSYRLLSRLSPWPQFFVLTLLRALPWLPPAWFLATHSPSQIYSVTGASMSPFFNLQNDDSNPTSSNKILVSTGYNLLPGLPGHEVTLQRGDIVVFHTPHNPALIAVKRVIGLPGDLVTPLPERPSSLSPDAVLIPFGHLWVEGDASSRALSKDSNWYGPISRSLVIGRAIAVIWPFSQFTHIKPSRGLSSSISPRVTSALVPIASPDEIEASSGFRAGYAELALERIRSDPDAVKSAFIAGTPKDKQRWAVVLNAAKAEIARRDPETRQLAQELLEEMTKLVPPGEGGVLEVPVEDPKRRLRRGGYLPRGARATASSQSAEAEGGTSAAVEKPSFKSGRE